MEIVRGNYNYIITSNKSESEIKSEWLIYVEGIRVKLGCLLDAVVDLERDGFVSFE